MIKIRKGLDLPIRGAPKQVIEDAPRSRSVAVLGGDFMGMKPTMEVRQGDRVKMGQVLFTDKKNPGVKYTSVGAGVVSQINRGDKRVLQSVVIELDGNEEVAFEQYSREQCQTLARDDVARNLINSGLWPAFRTRPFSKVPLVGSAPNSIFVTAMDTNPLAADPALIIAESSDDFTLGLDVVAKLTDGQVYVCHAPSVDIPKGNSEALNYQQFSGPHPAGLPGTHIHFLDAASESKTVWHISYQDIIAIGKLFLTGRLNVERVISLAGTRVLSPRLLRTQMGADIEELVAGQLEKSGQENRVISGSILSGHIARGPLTYLGRYHNQVSVIQENRARQFLGYMLPGSDKHSVLSVFISRFNRSKRFELTTSTHGSPRAIVPVGSYETVMPLDILPTQLLRALVIGDVEAATELGCLELDEEDLALSTYACPGKYEFGPILRDNLDRIEKES